MFGEKKSLINANVKNKNVNAENIPSVLRKKQEAAAVDAKNFEDVVPVAEMRVKPDIKPGDTLIVCKNGDLKGAEATVVNTGGRRVDVTVRGMPMTMKLTEDENCLNYSIKNDFNEFFGLHF